MDRLDKYRNTIRELLTEFSKYSSSDANVETQLIFDPERDHYQLVYVGWENNRWVYGVAIHLDLKDGKIWLQHNGTEAEIGEELAAMGIPKHDIVVGFHSPSKRKLTKYAVG